MNFIRHIWQLKMRVLRGDIVENPHSPGRFGVLLLLFLIITLMLGFVLVEPGLGSSILAQLVLPSELWTEPSKPGSSAGGQINLLAQSQFTPTVDSYPEPLPATSYPAPSTSTAAPTDNPPGTIVNPYPAITPDSTEQPLQPYPLSSEGQSPDQSHEFIQTPPSPNPTSPPAIGSDAPADSDNGRALVSQMSPAVSAMILWIGFLASLIIFMSAILWSIMYFTRQRNRS